MQLFVRNTLLYYSMLQNFLWDCNCRLIYYQISSILNKVTNVDLNAKLIKYLHSPSEEMYE